MAARADWFVGYNSFPMKKLIMAGLVLAQVVYGQDNGPFEPPASKTSPPPATYVKPVPVDLGPELADATSKLKDKFDAGKTSESDLAENINELITQHIHDGNREQVARLYLLDAHIYADGLKNSARARAIWSQVARQFPGTVAAKGASLSLAKLNAEMAADPGPNVPEGLDVGQKFPGFEVTDVAGNALSVSAYRGRVTMIDFWATWCPPCRGEMPNVIATYRQYHAQGFDIIGVSLDEDRDALLNFTQAQGIVWQQYFDGLGWKNQLVKKYGVNGIPMDYLLDSHGIIIGKELRGEELGAAVAKALTSN
jgi:thiol-disulfide isomerase/thioredoxin